MNPRTHYLITLASALVLSCAGCTSVSVEPIANGYELVTYSTQSREPEAQRIKLRYRTSHGNRVMICPSTAPPAVHGNTAVFVGSPHSLYAVAEPGPVVEITGRVMSQWAQSSGVAFDRLRYPYVSRARADRNALCIDLGFVDQNEWTNVTVQLQWDQISEMIRDGAEHGIKRAKDGWNIQYFESRP